MTIRLGVAVVVLGLVAGCGGAARHATAPSPVLQSVTKTTGTTTPTPSPTPPPLVAEARSAAAGDIPDNQVFLTYRSQRFSMKYPEGWAQSGSGGRLTFRDLNNIVRVVIGKGAFTRLIAAGATVTVSPRALTLPAGRAEKVVYRTVSAPNAVTGKRITLSVDRYAITGTKGKRAVVDLGTPVGVDNVDAYRMMVESFRWG
jgi:hypothetical protein